MTSPREKYERCRATFDTLVEEGEIDSATGDAIRELCDAYDGHNVMEPTPEDEGAREPSTLKAWVHCLKGFAKERDLTSASADELNGDVQAMHDGDHPAVKDDGIQKNTLRSHQSALRKFYEYHDFGVDPEEIPMFDQNKTGVDPNDMLTKEEVQTAREAAGNPRDRVIFDLLLYTGQRREALRTLRLKNVDATEGVYRLNPTVDGLKGANERNGKRPLLGAKGAVQNWLDYHPDTSDPENYLITARPSYAAVDPSSPVAGETLRSVMSKLKDKTPIEKPMNPHAMRHNFVTIAKKDYELPDDTIKYLIGHDADSTVMETTYSHLSGEDHVQRAEEAWGLREPEEESTLTPEVCPTCGEPLEPNAKACSRCGSIFTPDAKAVQDELEEDMWADKAEAEGDAETGLEELRALLNDHPELVEELTE